MNKNRLLAGLVIILVVVLLGLTNLGLGIQLTILLLLSPLLIIIPRLKR